MKTNHLSSMSAQAPTKPRDPRRWIMLAFVLCAALMGALDTFIVNVALPTIERDLHANFAEEQLMVVGFTLAFAVLLVTGGRMGDLYGRKRMFLLGVGGFTLCSALCGFAPNAPFLVLFRIAQGMAAALMIPQVISFIRVSFDEEERPHAFSAYTVVLSATAILGLGLGGLLLGANLLGMGWRSIFLINVPIGLLVLLVGGPMVRDPQPSEARRLDYGGVALLSAFLVLLVFPIVQGGDAGWPLWALICLVLSVPCFLGFLAYERRMARRDMVPLVSLSLFRLRSFTAGNITTLLNGALNGSVSFLYTFYAQTILHFTPLQSGLVFMAAATGFLTASSANIPIIRRLGHRSFSWLAALGTLGHVLLTLAAQFFVPWWGVGPLLIALYVFGFGKGLLAVPLLSRTLEEVAHDDVGVASGIFNTLGQTSSALGVAVIGVIFALLATSSRDPLTAFVISMLITTLLSFGLSLSVLPLNRAGKAGNALERGLHR